MDWARSGVAVMEEIMRSIFPVLSAGIKPSKGMFWISMAR